MYIYIYILLLLDYNFFYYIDLGFSTMVNPWVIDTITDTPPTDTIRITCAFQMPTHTHL